MSLNSPNVQFSTGLAQMLTVAPGEASLSLIIATELATFALGTGRVRAAEENVTLVCPTEDTNGILRTKEEKKIPFPEQLEHRASDSALSAYTICKLGLEGATVVYQVAAPLDTP